MSDEWMEGVTLGQKSDGDLGIVGLVSDGRESSMNI